MKLRYYAALMTWIATYAIGFLAMWFGTQKDILEIVIVLLMFTPLAPMAVMAFTEKPEKPQRRHVNENRKAA